MYRAAPASESKNLSSGALNSDFLRFQVLTATNTMTRLLRSSPNTTLTPANGIRRPPRAGPMVPARFIWIPPRAIAEGSCSFPTISSIADSREKPSSLFLCEQCKRLFDLARCLRGLSNLLSARLLHEAARDCPLRRVPSLRGSVSALTHADRESLFFNDSRKLFHLMVN